MPPPSIPPPLPSAAPPTAPALPSSATSARPDASSSLHDLLRPTRDDRSLRDCCKPTPDASHSLDDLCRSPSANADAQTPAATPHALSCLHDVCAPSAAAPPAAYPDPSLSIDDVAAPLPAAVPPTAAAPPTSNSPRPRGRKPATAAPAERKRKEHPLPPPVGTVVRDSLPLRRRSTPPTSATSAAPTHTEQHPPARTASVAQPQHERKRKAHPLLPPVGTVTRDSLPRQRQSTARAAQADSSSVALEQHTPAAPPPPPAKPAAPRHMAIREIWHSETGWSRPPVPRRVSNQPAPRDSEPATPARRHRHGRSRSASPGSLTPTTQRRWWQSPSLLPSWPLHPQCLRSRTAAPPPTASAPPPL